MNGNESIFPHLRNTNKLYETIKQLDTATVVFNKSNKALDSVQHSLPPNPYHQNNARRAARDRKTQAEEQTLSKLISRLTAELKDENDQAHDRLETKAAWTAAVATKALLVHDTKFDELEHVSLSYLADELPLHRVDELLQVLHHTECDLIRTRLNNAYLAGTMQDPATGVQHSTTPDKHTDHGNDCNATIEELKAELTVLTDEIEAVAEMLVAHTHRTELQTLDAEIQTKQTALNLQCEQSILDALTAMTHQTDAILHEAESLHSSRLFQREMAGYLSLLTDPDCTSTSLTTNNERPTQNQPSKHRSHLSLLKAKLAVPHDSTFTPSTPAAAADEFHRFTTNNLLQQQLYLDTLARSLPTATTTTTTDDMENSTTAALQELEQLELGVKTLKTRFEQII